MDSLYDELGVARDASADAIKAAHRRKVREHHPDRGGDKAKFQAVQLAYDTLRDEDRRHRYDETGETAGATNDPALHMLGTIVNNLISQMLQDGVPFETIDMHKAMVDSVAAKVREVKKERSRAERSLTRAAALARRWKRKSKATGADLIGDTIRRRERDLNEGMKRMTEALAAWERAAAMLDDYEYECDAAAPRAKAPSGHDFPYLTFVEFGETMRWK